MALFIAWLICGVITAVIASNKGRSGLGWLLIGCILGIFGIVLAAVISPIQRAPLEYEEPRRLLSSTKLARMKKCPDCAEHIRYDARVCKHCGYRFGDDEAAIDPRPERPDVNTSRWSKKDRERFEAMHAPSRRSKQGSRGAD